MPILHSKNIPGGSVVVWEITESIDELLSLYKPHNAEIKAYDSIIPEIKKKQWLSVRILLNELIPDSEICYDVYNKPFLKNSSARISISHTGNYAALILNNTNPVGIDIESTSDKILKIVSRFMNESELKNIFHDNRAEHATLYWCAKEAVYKLYGKRGLEFKTQIMVEPFVYAPSGNINVKLLNENNNKFYKLYYQTLNNNKLVYTVND